MIKLTVTFKISNNTKEKMVEYFEDKKREKTPPYAVFQANESDTVVTLYESNKVMFQGVSADIDANLWKEMEQHLNPGKPIEEGKKKKKTEEPVVTKYRHITSIGSDEVGTGDYFGPIVVTAAYVQKSDVAFLEDLGIKDSKKMTDEKILEVVPSIIKRIDYKSVILSNTEYNELHSASMNMNKLKAILHNKVLYQMKEAHPVYDRIIVDQFCLPKNYFHYLIEAKELVKDITFLTKAEDKCYSVACASVISRYLFIKEFDKLSKQVGMVLPKGAGILVDQAGMEIVSRFGKEKLREIAKLSFKNTDKILNH